MSSQAETGSEAESVNVVVVCGRLSSDPTTRELQSGSVLMSFELTTRVGQAAVSVPLVWFDPPRSVSFAAGDVVRAVGTVRRRFFRNGGATQSRTEVVVHSLGRSGDKRVAAAQQRWLTSAMGPLQPEGVRST